MTTIRKMLISLTAGAILGILYAPAKGRKTRKKISRIGGNIKDGWNSVAGSVASQMSDIADGSDLLSDETIEEIEKSKFSVNDKAGYL